MAALGRILVALLAIFCIGSGAMAREAGWVPLPASPDLAPGKARARKSVAKPRAPLAAPRIGTVYDNEPPVTEAELSEFVNLLPRFRAWTRKNGEEAHPVLTPDGKPDFVYSPQAANWVKEHNFEPVRFFCVMGRMAAAFVIVEEGNDFKGTRPPDMPAVSPQELDLARRHLKELLAASGPGQPIN